MGLVSARNADMRNEQQKAQNLANAAQTRYSAWSGLGAGQINNAYQNPFAQALSGGLQGAAFMQAMKKLDTKNTGDENTGDENQGDELAQLIVTSTMNQNPQLYGSQWGSFS